MKIHRLGLLLCALGLPWSTGALAAEPAYALERITDKIQVMYGPMELPDKVNRGFRNNVVVVTTRDGLVVFDPGGSAYAGEMVAKRLGTLSPAPIVAVFDSHAHGDHWLGNEGVKRVYPAAVIYGHPTMKARVEGRDGQYWLDSINRVTEGAAGGERVVGPDRTVDDGDLVKIGDTGFRVYHRGSAHTDNDIMIEVLGEDALFTGDVVRNGMLGIMEDDASFTGNVAAIDWMLEKGVRHYIPGHGRAGGREVPEHYRAYLVALRDAVQQLYDQGLADFEMKPQVAEAVSVYRSWAGFDLRLGPHISRVYLEIEAEHLSD